MIDREHLDKIIKSDGGNNWWKPKLFKEKTLPILPKDLEILAIPPSETENHNCFIYAFGLADDNEVVKDSGGFIYDSFFKKMIDLGELNYTDNPKNGDYVVYRDLENYPNMITHIGTKDGEKVISKCAWGPLLKHSILDVPASYGNDISYIKRIDKEKAKELYLKYKDFNKKM